MADRAPGSLEEIVEIALEEWPDNVEDIRTGIYFYSIPNRLADIIEFLGGHTKY